MNNDPYIVVDDTTIHVCAWCFPGEKILDLFPDLRGRVKISHGICQRHYDAKRSGLLRRTDVDETIMLDGSREPILLEVLREDRPA